MPNETKFTYKISVKTSHERFCKILLWKQNMWYIHCDKF